MTIVVKSLGGLINGIDAGEMRTLDRDELEVLTLSANGKSAEEIAASLKVSKSSVRNYLIVAARKLGARNTAHAVAIAVHRGLINSK